MLSDVAVKNLLAVSAFPMNQGLSIRRWLATAIRVIFAGGLVMSVLQQTVLAQDIERLRSGVVRITAVNSGTGASHNGTGFVVQHSSDNMFIVTAAHVVEGEKYPKVEFYARRNAQVEAEVLKMDPSNDIALLKIRDRAQIPEQISVFSLIESQRVSDGEEFTVIGFPGSHAWTAVKVTLSARDGVKLILDGNVKPGNSGGPVLKHDQIVGLITKVDQFGHAVPAEILAMALKGWGVALTDGQSGGTATAPKPPLAIEPEMVTIPAGKFRMGSNEGTSDEQTVHEVAIPRSFAMSRHEITVAQFRQFVQDKTYVTSAERNGQGCRGWNAEKKVFESQSERNWQNPGFSQGDDQPVVCVSWDDAQAYVQWLSGKTGKKYRLPTEAEWEYAARAGTQTRYWWGDDIDKNNAVCGDCGSPWDGKQTAPVGSFRPNAFGLYDTAGNVWEWTQDCWHDNYNNAPTDGSAWLEKDGGDCDRRVVRGGSWSGSPQFLRSALRGRFDSGDADDYLGFRIARAL